MYHMLPFSYRPEIRSSRSQHGAFQNKISQLIEQVLHETEIVDTDNPTGSKLFNAMDIFFSYGLLTADKTYWRCVQQFMPRAEKDMLIAECGNANDRYLSICWLKTAFNKGTLHFQMLALTNIENKRYLCRYYHQNSCIRNNGLLEAVTGFIGKLQNVQFAFYSTRQLRAEPVPAVVIDNAPVQLSSRAAARQRKMTETEASSDTVLNIVPTEIPAILTNTFDQDVLLNEIVRNRHIRITNEQNNAQKVIYEEDVSAKEEPKEPEEKLEDVLVKTMSAINMDSLSTPLVEVLAQKDEYDEQSDELAEGEYQMQQGDILHLAINVFEEPSEKVTQTFIVFEKFYSDAKEVKYFVMTNYNFFVLRYEKNTESPQSDRSESPVLGTFKPELRIPHDRIRLIQVATDNTSFIILSTDAGFITYDDMKEVDNSKKTSYYASNCGFKAGSNIFHSIHNVTEHSSRGTRPTIEFDDHFAYVCLFQPSLEKQLKKQVDIRSTTLCYWYEQQVDVSNSPTTMSGYLYKRNVSAVSNWLLKNQAEPEQKYCMLSGMKLYIFVDSTCKEGEAIIDLSESEYSAEGRNAFSLNSPQGNFEFEATNKDEFAQWITTILNAIENSGNQIFLTPCLAVFSANSISIVQEGERFWFDGFLRLLGEICLSEVKECILAFQDEDSPFGNQHPAICLVMKNDTINYFFVRYESEMNRIADVIQEIYKLEPITLGKNLVKTPIGKIIHNVCCSLKPLWSVE